MFLLIVYNDLEQEEIIAFIKFKFVKNIITWSNNTITYADLNRKTKKRYKKYKRLFKIIKLA